MNNLQYNRIQIYDTDNKNINYYSDGYYIYNDIIKKWTKIKTIKEQLTDIEIKNKILNNDIEIVILHNNRYHIGRYFGKIDSNFQIDNFGVFNCHKFSYSGYFNHGEITGYGSKFIWNTHNEYVGYFQNGHYDHTKQFLLFHYTSCRTVYFNYNGNERDIHLSEKIQCDDDLYMKHIFSDDEYTQCIQNISNKKWLEYHINDIDLNITNSIHRNLQIYNIYTFLLNKLIDKTISQLYSIPIDNIIYNGIYMGEINYYQNNGYKPNGFGEFYCNEFYFKGMFINGYINGNGIKFKDNNKIIGNFVNGLPMGECISLYTHYGYKIIYDKKGNYKEPHPIWNDRINSIENIYIKNIVTPIEYDIIIKNKTNLKWLKSEQNKLNDISKLYNNYKDKFDNFTILCKQIINNKFIQIQQDMILNDKFIKFKEKFEINIIDFIDIFNYSKEIQKKIDHFNSLKYTINYKMITECLLIISDIITYKMNDDKLQKKCIYFILDLFKSYIINKSLDLKNSREIIDGIKNEIKYFTDILLGHCHKGKCFLYKKGDLSVFNESKIIDRSDSLKSDSLKSDSLDKYYKSNTYYKSDKTMTEQINYDNNMFRHYFFNEKHPNL